MQALQVSARFHDFLSCMEFTEFGNTTAIVVGHSLFFRELCRRYISPALERSNPELAADLKRHKLSNASCLAIDVDFDQDIPHIVNAELM